MAKPQEYADMHFEPNHLGGRYVFHDDGSFQTFCKLYADELKKRIADRLPQQVSENKVWNTPSPIVEQSDMEQILNILEDDQFSVFEVSIYPNGNNWSLDQFRRALGQPNTDVRIQQKHQVLDSNDRPQPSYRYVVRLQMEQVSYLLNFRYKNFN